MSERPEDRILRRYLALAQRVEARRSLLATMAGSCVCAHCGGGPRKRISGRYSCASCGARWKGMQLVSRIQSSGPLCDPLLSVVDSWRRVRSLIETPSGDLDQYSWDLEVCCWIAFLDPAIGSYSLVAGWARTQHPKVRSWNARLVAKMIQHARGVVLDRIGYTPTSRAAGIFEVSQRTVQRMVNCGTLSSVRHAGQAYVRIPGAQANDT